MVDITNIFLDLVAKKSPAGDCFNTRNAPPNPLTSAINEITSELQNVRLVVLSNVKSYLREMNFGINKDPDVELLGTQQLLAGAAQHMSQLEELVQHIGSELHSQPRGHVMAAVSAMYAMLQEITTPFGILQAAARQQKREIERFKKLGYQPEIEPVQVAAKPKFDSKKRSTANGIISSRHHEEPLEPGLEEKLAQENVLLRSKLDDISSDVQEVERTAVSLSALSGLFASKVEEQNELIEQLRDEAQESTENVRAATKQIQQALRRSLSLHQIVAGAAAAAGVLLLILHRVVP
eukprot:TRINITY_DN7610_c0_g1_i1.p1 TRINITY_DN7610_c0_g1~~TRINITY_DN7610_c0_g1_i1.p1  ORF type:complete len:302 (-),score=62.87 TRINITY_DN7610_c0_g1_i1:26-907(-)